MIIWLGSPAWRCVEARSAADYYSPAAHAPISNKAFGDVRIVFCEASGDSGVVTTKNQSGTVDGIRKSSSHHEFASTMCLFQYSQMIRAKRCAPIDEIVHNFVYQHEIHIIASNG